MTRITLVHHGASSSLANINIDPPRRDIINTGQTEAGLEEAKGG